MTANALQHSKKQTIRYVADTATRRADNLITEEIVIASIARPSLNCVVWQAARRERRLTSRRCNMIFKLRHDNYASVCSSHISNTLKSPYTIVIVYILTTHMTKVSGYLLGK